MNPRIPARKLGVVIVIAAVAIAASVIAFGMPLEPTSVAFGNPGCPHGPSVALDSSGTPNLVWSDGSEIWIASVNPATGAFGLVRLVGHGNELAVGCASPPSLATSSQSLFVAWPYANANGATAIDVTSVPLNGSGPARPRLVPEGPVSGLEIAAAPDGDVFLVWFAELANRSRDLHFAALRAGQDRFTSVRVLASGALAAPAIAESGGGVYVAWLEGNASDPYPFSWPSLRVVR